MTIATTIHSHPSRTVPKSPLADSDRLVLTVTEAGELLGISRAFAYELVARGELPVIRLGRRRLVPRWSHAAGGGVVLSDWRATLRT
jgi:excisionase family DNA binding protein